MGPVRYHTEEPLSFLREWLEMHPPPVPVRVASPVMGGVHLYSSKPAGVHRRVHAEVIDGKLVIRDSKPANMQAELFGRTG